ncbi:MAG: poly-gamma-glutamate system protein [Deltaproteobacteria bacterium]|nr:poly-gamma-glutamate system protein [Deltaproteobacteria bacterium]
MRKSRPSLDSCRDPYRKGKLPLRSLAILAVAAIAVILCLEAARAVSGDRLRSEKRAARDLMTAAMQTIKAEREKLGIPIDPMADPGGTGLIGAAYNDLTTTTGSLASKRTSTNPEFAVVVVEMLAEAGVRPGDPVAVSFSGSFPALNIAVLSAVHAMKLKPVIVSSIGASMYGANHPDLTWLDMERVLSENGLLPYRSVAASLGGIADTKGGLDGTGIDAGLRAIGRNKIPLLREGGDRPLRVDIGRRMELYDRELAGRKPAAFINVGGAATSLGHVPGVERMPTGLLMKVPAAHGPDRGILFLMGERGVPVLHLLRIRTIAAQYGIPFDPLLTQAGIFPDRPGRGRYSPALAVAGLVLLLVLMVFLMRRAAGRGRIRWGVF